jgi:hypothetical protein
MPLFKILTCGKSCDPIDSLQYQIKITCTNVIHMQGIFILCVGRRPNIAFSMLYVTTTCSYLYLRKVIGRRPISPQKDCLEVPLGKGYLMPEVV